MGPTGSILHSLLICAFFGAEGIVISGRTHDETGVFFQLGGDDGWPPAMAEPSGKHSV